MAGPERRACSGDGRNGMTLIDPHSELTAPSDSDHGIATRKHGSPEPREPAATRGFC
jgi:hypothetical protein